MFSPFGFELFAGRNCEFLTLSPNDFHSESNLGLFLEYAKQHDEREVPDPHHGGAESFECVLNMVEDAAEGLLAHIQQIHLQEV